MSLAVLLLAVAAVRAETLAQVATDIGADTLYGMGYTGTRAIVGNVEAGLTRDDHEALPATTVTQQVGWELPKTYGVTLTVQSHATQVGGTIAGQANATTGTGVAYGAELWSGQIATSFGAGGSFSVSGNSLLYPLMIFGQYGIGGQTVDVVNSSWSGTNDTGNSVINVVYDYLANVWGVTMVCSAGNSGAGPGTVGTPANGWNVIAVGATTGSGASETVTTFSSGGPTGSFNLAGTRTKPDIVAPGVSITMPTTGATDAYATSSGTSFSAPIVAGAAALLIDYAKDTGRSTDPRLVKAVLLNSAVKLSGWTQMVGTHPTTNTRINYTPLDEGQGAGRVDLTRAYAQYSASTGTGTGTGAVAAAGWDTNIVGENAPTNYLIDQVVTAGTTLSATLIWFMDRSVTGYNPSASDPYSSTVFSNDSFDDLDLLLYLADVNGNPTGDPVAASISGWDSANPDDPATGLDSVEQLYLQVPTTGRYVLQVRWTQELFDFVGDPQIENYALAWQVPEPATLLTLGAGGLLLVIRRRR